MPKDYLKTSKDALRVDKVNMLDDAKYNLAKAKAQQDLINRDKVNLTLANKLGLKTYNTPNKGSIDYLSTDVRNSNFRNPLSA